MNDEDVIKTVRLRCRICEYLLASAMGWSGFWGWGGIEAGRAIGCLEQRLDFYSVCC